MLTFDYRLIIAVILASLPALIWGGILMARNVKHRSLLVTVFLAGTLTVVPVLGLQWLYLKLIGQYPDADFVANLKGFFSNWPYAWTVILFVYVGITEEIAKFLVVRYADQTRPDLIQTVNDSVYFAILSGLGFAFSENIFYFYRTLASGAWGDLFVQFTFRSVFTVCAHAMFSGIFGYFYGVSKFATEFVKMREWQGQTIAYLKGLSRIFAEDIYVTFRYWNMLLGLILALSLHAAFNIYLEVGKVFPVLVIVVLMFIFLTYLLRSRAGKLEFILADKHRSTMNKADEDVVLELVGMWFKEGRYQDVINVCKRLLRRDPDNDVAKLFLAQAIDKKKRRQVLSAIKGLFADDEGINEKTLLD